MASWKTHNTATPNCSSTFHPLTINSRQIFLIILFGSCSENSVMNQVPAYTVEETSHNLNKQQRVGKLLQRYTSNTQHSSRIRIIWFLKSCSAPSLSSRKQQYVNAYSSVNLLSYMCFTQQLSPCTYPSWRLRFDIAFNTVFRYPFMLLSGSFDLRSESLLPSEVKLSSQLKIKKLNFTDSGLCRLACRVVGWISWILVSAEGGVSKCLERADRTEEGFLMNSISEKPVLERGLRWVRQMSRVMGYFQVLFSEVQSLSLMVYEWVTDLRKRFSYRSEYFLRVKVKQSMSLAATQCPRLQAWQMRQSLERSSSSMKSSMEKRASMANERMLMFLVDFRRLCLGEREGLREMRDLNMDEGRSCY